VAASIDRRLASSLAGTYIDTEQLLLWDPDVIFIDESSLDPVWQDLQSGLLNANLTALQTGRVHTLMTYNSYAVNYEIALVNSWYIGQILYPETFDDIKINEKAAEIIEMFTGKPVFSETVTPNSFKTLINPPRK
jgi:iron complex transport system substrate-binding protein